MAEPKEKELDMQAFFESRQDIAAELGDLRSQRRITDIRRKMQEQKLEEEQTKTKTKTKTKEGDK